MFFYFPVLFLGRTLQGPEMLRMNSALKSPPSYKSILEGKVTPSISNTDQMTGALMRFPQDIRMGKLYRSHELPLWDAHEALGMPFAAQAQSSSFFPIRIIRA